MWNGIAASDAREAVAATEDFDSFYTATFPRLASQLTLVTGDPHEAEDLVQEAMARAAPRWGRLRAYDSPEAWVRRVAFNLAVSGHRRAGGGGRRCGGWAHRPRSRRSRWRRWRWPRPCRG